MTGWPDSELRPIRYAKFFRRPLLPRLPVCSPSCRAASLLTFFFLFIFNFFIFPEDAGLKLQLPTQSKGWALRGALLPDKSKGFGLRCVGFSSGKETVGTSVPWVTDGGKTSSCFLVVGRGSTEGCFLPAPSVPLWFYQTASGRDGVAERGDAAGGLCWLRDDPKGRGTTHHAGGHRVSCPLLPSSVHASRHHGPCGAQLLIIMSLLNNSFLLPPQKMEMESALIQLIFYVLFPREGNGTFTFSSRHKTRSEVLPRRCWRRAGGTTAMGTGGRGPRTGHRRCFCSQPETASPAVFSAAVSSSSSQPCRGCAGTPRPGQRQ